MTKLVTINGVKGYLDGNGMAHLSLDDVSRGLGFTQVKDGKEYIRWETVNGYLESFGFSQEVGKEGFVPENIFYRLAMKAKNEAAEKFQTKVADEILPSIRKHGIYATDSVIEQILSNPDFGIELLTTLKAERQKRIEAERTNAILMHVNKTYTTTEIAKEMGLKSANALNARLQQMRVHYKQNETWVLYSRYADKGYVDIKQDVLDSGKVIYHRRWTQLGREFLLKMLAQKEAV